MEQTDANSQELTLKATPEYPQISCKEHEFVVMSSLKAPFFEDENRAPIDLVAVVDNSGSMGGEKIELVRKTLNFVTTQLQARDRFGIITFETKIAEELPLCSMDEYGKIKAEKAIARIKDRGSTNLSGGLLAGLKMIRERPQANSNEVSSVLLFTDGQANHGIVDTKGIITAMKNPDYNTPQTESSLFDADAVEPPQVQKQSETADPESYLPCTVYTFGYGSDHNTDMLKAIAEAGKGVYYFVENPDSIADSFADCLGGLLSIVAQNIKLTIESAGDVKIKKILTKHQEVQAGKEYLITLGDLQSEEQKDLLSTISIPAGPPSTELPIIKLKLEYYNVLTGKNTTLNATGFISRVEDAVLVPDLNVSLQRLRVATADALVNATAFAESGKFEEGGVVLDSILKELNDSGLAEHEIVKGLIEDLVQSKQGLSSKQAYASKGEKMMKNMEMEHRYQRNCRGGEASRYKTAKKEAMKKK